MRLVRHLFAPSAQRLFPAASLERIGAAIAEGERLHNGQVMFAVESGLAPAQVLRGMAPRLRAEHAFAQLRTWDTEANNGVLIYLLLADHHIEIGRLPTPPLGSEIDRVEVIVRLRRSDA